MNILIVANHYAVASGRYAADAFTRLGHTVRHVGPAKGRDIWGLTLPAEYVWEPDYAAGAMWAFIDWKEPDVILFMDSAPDILDVGKLYEMGVPHIPQLVWGVDNHVRDYRRPWFDHYFLAHKSVSVMDWRDDMTWLPCASSVAFEPSLIPWDERAYDVACLGVPYPQRLMLIDAMKAAGLKVARGNGLVYENFASVYHNSRVSLCVSSNHDLAQRIYETGRLGCAVLSDVLPDLLLFDTTHPVAQFYSVDEAVEMAKALQHQPLIAEACAEWAMTETWEKRAEVIVSWYNERK